MGKQLHRLPNIRLDANTDVGLDEASPTYGLAVDGAIIRAQFDPTADDALLGLQRILKSLLIKKLPQAPRQR
jgi:hypothetical protein